MRRLFPWLLLSCLLAVVIPSRAATGRVMKVLPHLLDLEGRHMLAPSLYERDAYQAQLRLHPEKISGIRFDVEWKAKDAKDTPLKLRVEIHGVVREGKPQNAVLEEQVVYKSWLSQWDTVSLTGDKYKKLGEVTAWRVTLWEQDHMIGEQKSFLW